MMRIALLSTQLTLESGAYGLENHMTSQAEEQCGPSCGGDKSGKSQQAEFGLETFKKKRNHY